LLLLAGHKAASFCALPAPQGQLLLRTVAAAGQSAVPVDGPETVLSSELAPLAGSLLL
jgi:hypothetical protein